MGTEASNTYLDREQPSTPAFFLAKIQELCVVCLLPLVGLLTPCLPWHCQLNDNELHPCLGPQFDVWSYGRLDHIWKTSLFPKSASMFKSVVPPRIDEPALRFCNVGCAVCVLPTLRFCNVGCAVYFLLVSPDLTKEI